MTQATPGPAEAATGFDVVFIAPDDPSGSRRGARRTVVFVPGQPIPRTGECVIIAFGGDPERWEVRDVAHVFEADGHGIAIKLAPPAA